MSRSRWIVSVASPDGTHRTWRFPPAEVRVGRDASCAVRLEDARVAGVHLRLLLGDDAARVIATGNRHPTLVGSAPLTPDVAAALEPNAVVLFADHGLTVGRDAEGGWTTDSRETSERREEARLGLDGLRGGAWTLEQVHPGPARRRATLGPEAVVVVGGSPRCDVCVPDAGLLARQGRVVRRDGGAPLWEALGPDGEPLAMPLLLADGAVLDVGAARLVVRAPGVAGPAAAGEALPGLGRPTPDAPPRGGQPPSAPPDRLYAVAIVLAVVGGLLALAAGVFAARVP